MVKYLIFNEDATTADIGDEAHDVYMADASRLRGITNDGTGGVDLVLHFAGSAEGEADGDASSGDTVTLTITANKHVKVMKELAQAINQGPNSDGAIVLFDAESGTSFSSDVSAIAIAVSAAD
jgi:hypothetical protein|tara:strand:- start:40 stop:408 length:369 start_codon:yes stop_codon:yes gene_type:complete